MRFLRRGMLIAALAGGGLAVGYVVRPRSFPLPLSPAPGEIAFDAWIKIAPDGVVSVAVPQLEMGQGITTLIAQVVATELGADWRHIAIEPSPVSAHYANLPLLADCPQIEVELIASNAPTADPGELGVVAAPPAIGNALFSATGLRFRRLPLLSEGL